MTTHPLRERVDRNIDAVVEAPAQVRRVERRVNHESDLFLGGDFGDCLEIEYVEARITDEFTVNEARVVLDS